MNYELIVDYIDECLVTLKESDDLEEKNDLLVEIWRKSKDWERNDAADVILYLLGKVNNV